MCKSVEECKSIAKSLVASGVTAVYNDATDAVDICKQGVVVKSIHEYVGDVYHHTTSEGMLATLMYDTMLSPEDMGL